MRNEPSRRTESHNNGRLPRYIEMVIVPDGQRDGFFEAKRKEASGRAWQSNQSRNLTCKASLTLLIHGSLKKYLNSCASFQAVWWVRAL